MERSLTAGTASDVRVVVVDVVVEGSPVVVVVVDDVVKLRQLQSGAEDVEAENRLRCGPADLRSRNLQGEKLAPVRDFNTSMFDLRQFAP